MEDESSFLRVCDEENKETVRLEAIPEASVTTTDFEMLETTEPSQDQQAELLTDAQDTIKGIGLPLTFDIAFEVAVKVPEPPLVAVAMAGTSDDAHMDGVHDEEAVDYEGSAGEEPTKLSSDIDDAWDSAVDTSSK